MNSIKRHSMAYLRAISQTFFLENALFGALLLTLFLVFRPDLFVSGLAASLAGYVYSVRYSTPTTLRAFGLIPVNGFFFGIAMAALFEPSPEYYLCVLLGALAVPPMTKAVHEILQHWKLSPFIIPYIIVVWLFSLYASSGLEGLQPNPFALVAEPSALSVYLDSRQYLSFLLPVLLSTGRLLFLPDATFGLAALALLVAFSPKRGGAFLLGTLLAVALFRIPAAGGSSWQEGTLTFSAGLVGLALASFPEKFRPRTLVLFCVLSSLVTIAAGTLLSRLQLPILSLPYVLTVWLATLSRTPRVSLSWAGAEALGWKSLSRAEEAVGRLRVTRRTDRTGGGEETKEAA